MKKFISLAAAGALLLSSAGAVFAWGIDQSAFTKSTTTAISGSGLNFQTGGSKQFIFSGDSQAMSSSITGSNVAIGGKSVDQNAFTTSSTSAFSLTGGNLQFGSHDSHHGSTQVIDTGLSMGGAESVTVSNFSFSFGH